MILVLDTNVVISGMLSPEGPAAEITRRWEKGEFDVVVSPELLAELGGALQYPKVAKYIQFSQEELSSFLQRYANSAVSVSLETRLEVIEDDPDDNRVLECAVAGGASFIVSGDKHFLALKEYEGIVMLSPAAFLAFFDAK
jgi:uncharacterized protein